MEYVYKSTSVCPLVCPFSESPLSEVSLYLIISEARVVLHTLTLNLHSLGVVL